MKRIIRSISIDPETWTAVTLTAKAMNRSASDYVREILREQIKKNGFKSKEITNETHNKNNPF